MKFLNGLPHEFLHFLININEYHMKRKSHKKVLLEKGYTVLLYFIGYN